MDNKRKLQIVIAMLVVTIVGASSILIPYIVRQRGGVVTEEEELLAWRTQFSAEAVCEVDTIKVRVSFENREPNEPQLAMNVRAIDQQSGQSTDLGTVNPGSSAEGSIDTGTNSVDQGEMKFELTWADGHSGSDSRVAHYSAQDCAGTPARIRISHMDCSEILAVMPDAPQGLEGTQLNCQIKRPPDNSQAAIILDWSRYDGPVAKWAKPKGDFFTQDGEYRLESCDPILDHTVENLPFVAQLSCTPPTATPTMPPQSTPTLTPTLAPHKCTLTIQPKSQPSSTPTPTPTGTLTPTLTPTITPTPTMTPTGTLTPSPSPTLTLTPTATPTSTPTSTPTGSPTPTGTPGPSNTPTPQPQCDSACTSDVQCQQYNSEWTCNSSTLTCRNLNYPQQEDCNPPGISCNKPCSTDSECTIENPDYICYNTGSTTLCRHEDNPGDSDCQGTRVTPTPPPGSTSTPTPPPGSTATPTPPPGSTLTPTPTSIVLADGGEPQLPSVGNSWPTWIMSGFGILIIGGALLLAL